jgi:hypothetical protein
MDKVQKYASTKVGRYQAAETTQRTVIPHMTDPSNRQGGRPMTDNTQIFLNKLKYDPESESEA